MKKNYLIKTTALLALALLCFSSLSAQVRITKLDPATNSVTLKNFGSANVPIAGYWFCNFPAYGQVSSMTSVTSLDAGEEVNIASSINFAVADGEFGLYTSSLFSSSSAMIDYMQWGSAGHQRESVAAAAGVWDVGTFISVAPPFEYTGDGSQNGVAFWSTLGIEDFEQGSNIKLYPNPSNSTLYVTIQNMGQNGSLEVYNILGKKVFSQKLEASQVINIDVSQWNNGLYLIKIASDTREETKRFLKQ